MQVFSRIKEERERLGLSQDAFAKAGGVSKRAHIYYEQGERSPSADYLAGIAEIGVDVAYIITGIRHLPVQQAEQMQVAEERVEPGWQESEEGISQQERILLENYRSLSEEDKRAIRRQSDVFAELNRMKSQQKDKKAG